MYNKTSSFVNSKSRGADRLKTLQNADTLGENDMVRQVHVTKVPV